MSKTAAASDPSEQEETPPGRDLALVVLSSFAGIAVLFSMVCAGFSMPSNPLPAIMTASLICGASLATGGLLGFLFGIPRTPTGDTEKNNSDSQSGNSEERAARLPYLPNTNLEQISDWLTKILVGVGLTQIGSLPSKLDALAGYGAGCFAGSKAMTLAVLVYFSLAGFLIGFLWTRLYLPRALRDADVVEKLEATQKQVANLQRAKASEQHILRVIEQQLSPDAPSMPLEKLTEEITKASHTERSQIFYRAATVRTTTWRDPLTKPVMERTIPIFRALIQADPSYYRTHGQLGFALKDSRTPQWSEALRELTVAIDLRDKLESATDDSAERSEPWYEYVRAQCRIHLDPGFQQKQPSDSETRRAILADIDAAARLGPVVFDDQDIREWAQLNRVDLPRTESS